MSIDDSFNTTVKVAQPTIIGATTATVSHRSSSVMVPTIVTIGPMKCPAVSGIALYIASVSAHRRQKESI